MEHGFFDRRVELLIYRHCECVFIKIKLYAYVLYCKASWTTYRATINALNNQYSRSVTLFCLLYD